MSLQLNGHAGTVRGVSFCSDGLASSGAEGSVWRVVRAWAHVVFMRAHYFVRVCPYVCCVYILSTCAGHFVGCSALGRARGGLVHGGGHRATVVALTAAPAVPGGHTHTRMCPRLLVIPVPAYRWRCSMTGWPRWRSTTPPPSAARHAVRLPWWICDRGVWCHCRRRMLRAAASRLCAGRAVPHHGRLRWRCVCFSPLLSF